MGPIRHALESLKTIADTFEMSLEAAADAVDRMQAKEKAHKAQTAEHPNTDGLIARGPTRTQ